MATVARKAAYAAGGLALVAAAWVGASYQTGRTAAAEIGTFVAGPVAQPGMRIASARHDAGILSSSGKFELRFEDHCDPASPVNGMFALQMEYRLSHLVLPGSLMRVEWQVTPAGQAGAMLAKATNDEMRLEGQGTVSHGRTLTSTLAMPALSFGTGPESLRVSASSGTVTIGAADLGLEWKTERIAASGAGKALEVLNLGLDMKLANRQRGTGMAALSIERIGAGFGNLEGLKLVSETVERADRTDITFTPSVRSMRVGDQSARDLSMQIALRDLHTASVETIRRIASESCGFRALTPPEQQAARGAVRTLLGSGLSLGIQSVKGTIGEGSLDGQFKVELLKGAVTAGAESSVELARLLKSSGEIVLKGRAVTAEQREMALSMGIATEAAGGLRAAFDYANGALSANGARVDAGPVQGVLAQADMRLNAFLGAKPVAIVAPAHGSVTPVVEGAAPLESGEVAAGLVNAAPPVR